MQNSSKIGFDKNNVTLAEHDPYWTALYAVEAAALVSLLGDTVKQIDHFGSTSIPTIKAKPVIDILVQADTAEVDDDLIRKFKSRGYLMKAFADRKEKLFYKEENGLRTYNVHVAKIKSEFAKNMLRFRDSLRANEPLAKEYEAVKLQEAANNPNDSQAYYDSKRHFFRKAIDWDY